MVGYSAATVYLFSRRSGSHIQHPFKPPLKS
jgi:hypothetical protein